MSAPRLLPLLLVLGCARPAAVATGGAEAAAPRAGPLREAPDSSSARWLALLPEGEEKRRFLLDCTGCHQFDARTARKADGTRRTREEWHAVVTRMLGFAGATTGFPVIADGRDPAATAAWLERHLRAEPVLAAPTAARAMAGSPRHEVTEFRMPVPRDLPHDLAVDARGRVVITGMFSDAMWVLDPATGSMSREAIPVERANPRAVEIDSLGNWWVVLGAPNRLARRTPDGGWSSWDVGVYPHSLAVDPRGRVWYNGHFTRSPALVGAVDARTGEVRTDTVPAHPLLAARPGGPIPYEIRLGPDGRLWMSELQGNRLVALDPATGRVDTLSMPHAWSGPRRFDVDARGMLWIPAYASNALVRLDPRTRRFTEYPLPIRDAVPYVVRVDDRAGVVWIGTAAADAVLRFDPSTASFTAIALPTRGALVRHLAIDPRTRDLWVAYGASPGIAARVARVRRAGGR